MAAGSYEAAYSAWIAGGRKGQMPTPSNYASLPGDKSTPARPLGDNKALAFLSQLISGDLSTKELSKDQIKAIQSLKFGDFNYNKKDLAKVGLKLGDISHGAFMDLKQKLKGFSLDDGGLSRKELAKFTDFTVSTLQKETQKNLEDAAAGLVPPPPKFGLARAGVNNASQAQFARLAASGAPGVRSLIGTSTSGDPRFGRLKNLAKPMYAGA